MHTTVPLEGSTVGVVFLVWQEMWKTKYYSISPITCPGEGGGVNARVMVQCHLELLVAAHTFISSSLQQKYSYQLQYTSLMKLKTPLYPF